MKTSNPEEGVGKMGRKMREIFLSTLDEQQKIKLSKSDELNISRLQDNTSSNATMVNFDARRLMRAAQCGCCTV